jgi:hypothetical protein
VKATRQAGLRISLHCRPKEGDRHRLLLEGPAITSYASLGFGYKSPAILVGAFLLPALVFCLLSPVLAHVHATPHKSKPATALHHGPKETLQLKADYICAEQPATPLFNIAQHPTAMT